MRRAYQGLLLGGGIAGLAFLVARADPLDQGPGTSRPYSQACQQLLDSLGETRAALASSQAIEAARHSLRLEPSLPALFNLALALEQWDLRARAILACRRSMARARSYLEEDSQSDWAEEAAHRLERLEQGASDDRAISEAGLDFPALPQNPWATRQRGERLLLTRWAEHILAGRDSEAQGSPRRSRDPRLDPARGRRAARIARLAHGHQQFARMYRSCVETWSYRQEGVLPSA